MKFYSEITKQVYDTADKCTEAEKEFMEAKNKRENEEGAAKAELESLYQRFNDENEAVNIALKARANVSKQLQSKITAFSRRYGYIPEQLKAFNIFTWLVP